MVRDRHLDWYATVVEQATPRLLGQAAWLVRLDREHDNLRAALQWAVDRNLSTQGLRLAAGLWQFWRTRTYYSEGRRWLAAVLALMSDKQDAMNQGLRASALDGAAWLAEMEHDFAQASSLFAESGTLRRALGQEERTTAALMTAALAARADGNYARATALLDESLAQHRAQRNREGIMQAGLGASLTELAMVLREQGEFARATALNEECLALHSELNDREGMGRALLSLSDVARDTGETERARAYGLESLSIFEELSPRWAGFSLNNLALAAYLDGDFEQAARRARESETLFRELQAGPSLAEVLITLGRAEGAQGATAPARSHLREALELATAKGPRFLVAAALEAMGVQEIRDGQTQDAVRMLAAADALRQAMRVAVRPADRPDLEGALATACTTMGDDAFATAFTTGQTAPLEQAVADALEFRSWHRH
jgi:tetratricopeptide (TPR) repeat protein